MPDVPPYGLRDFDALGAPRPVTSVWLADSNGVFQIADYAAEFDPVTGVPQAVWARLPNSPGTLTATPLSSHDIQLTWAAPVLRAYDTVIVTRSDGSQVGVFDRTVTSTVDGGPLIGSHAYQVRGILAGVEAATATSSAAVTAGGQPASFTATWNAGTNKVDFVWTHHANGAPDFYQITRVADGAQVATVSGALTALSVDATSGGPIQKGMSGAYRITPVVRDASFNWQYGVSRDSGTVNIPPAAPINVALNVPSGFGNRLDLTYQYSGDGQVNTYRIETSPNNSTWTFHSNDGDGFQSITTSQTLWVRVRAEANGGNSSYITVGPRTPNTDVTPPGQATITSWKPESSYGRMVIRATMPNDVDVNWWQVQYATAPGGPWTTVGESGSGPGQTIAHEVGYFTAGQTIYGRVNTRDTVGNTTIGTSTAGYTLIASPTAVQPTDATTWIHVSGGGSHFTGGNIPGQGERLGVGTLIGLWYYGTQLRDFLQAHTVYGANIQYRRRDSGGEDAPHAPEFWAHFYPSQDDFPIVYTFGDPEGTRYGSWVARTYQQYGEWWIPAHWLDDMRAGNTLGLAVWRTGGGWLGDGTSRYYIEFDPPDGHTGAVRMYHLG